MLPLSIVDHHAQLRRLCALLMEQQERFDEFRHLLSLYPDADQDGVVLESSEGAAIREQLNERISDWIGRHFFGLNPTQVKRWRSIIVEERLSVASPFRASITCR